jgi:hypothetical protein
MIIRIEKHVTRNLAPNEIRIPSYIRPQCNRSMLATTPPPRSVGFTFVFVKLAFFGHVTTPGAKLYRNCNVAGELWNVIQL